MMGLVAAVVLAMAAAASPAADAAPVETFLDAPGPVGTLKGTMLAPASATGPVVLIIPGSGPTDRDGNNVRGLKGSIYKQLAEGLAAHGVATVRIDKRGMFASGGAVLDADAVTIPDYAADARAWTATIRAKTGVACVWLLGHSEGGLVALDAAKEGGDYCGLILVSAAGRPVGQALREQMKANPAAAPVLDQALEAIAVLEAGKHVDTTDMSPALLPLFGPKVQNFAINVLSYDPAKLLAGYARPVLILRGDRDIQVGMADARRLQQADPKAKLVVLPDTNHVLKPVTSDDRAANVATYTNSDLPIAPKVVETIADFVTVETKSQ
jgi:pimeloyl-ACP methyl ester carboxylesterase